MYHFIHMKNSNLPHLVQIVLLSSEEVLICLKKQFEWSVGCLLELWHDIVHTMFFLLSFAFWLVYRSFLHLSAINDQSFKCSYGFINLFYSLLFPLVTIFFFFYLDNNFWFGRIGIKNDLHFFVCFSRLLMYISFHQPLLNCLLQSCHNLH